MKKEDIKKLLESQHTYWICPVTGKKINSEDTAAIAQYKEKLLKDAQKEDEQNLIKDGVKKIHQKVKINSRQDLEKYCTDLAKFLKITPPTISIKNFQSKDVKNGFAVHLNMFEMNFKNSRELKVFKTFSKLHIQFIANQIYGQISHGLNGDFSAKIQEWRKQLLSNPCKSNPEIVEQYQETIATLHQAKKEHVLIEEEMLKIREKLLSTDEFVDTLSKVKKNKR